MVESLLHNIRKRHVLLKALVDNFSVGFGWRQLAYALHIFIFIVEAPAKY